MRERKAEGRRFGGGGRAGRRRGEKKNRKDIDNFSINFVLQWVMILCSYLVFRSVTAGQGHEIISTVREAMGT